MVLIAAVGLAAPVPKNLLPPLGETNANTLIKKFSNKLTCEASSEWQQWPATHAVDGNEETSWFSASQDTASAGATPWVLVTFPEDVAVRRVSLRGNRDPQYPTGYFITAGKLELLDAAGKVLSTHDLTSAGDKHDLTWMAKTLATGVRTIKFTATKDDATNGCVSLGEFQVE
jgi:hypothetical protein